MLYLTICLYFFIFFSHDDLRNLTFRTDLQKKANKNKTLTEIQITLYIHTNTINKSIKKILDKVHTHKLLYIYTLYR